MLPERNTILVAEDLVTFRDAIAQSLGETGYRVMTAKSGDEVLEHFAVESPDLLLLDLSLEGTDGITCLRELRERYPQDICPIFVLTGHKDPLVMRVVRQLCVAAYYVKSEFSLPALLKDIQGALYGRRPAAGVAEKNGSTQPQPEKLVLKVSPYSRDALGVCQTDVDEWG